MEDINGKVYPMWSQLVAKKNEFIGGILEDSGDSLDRRLGAKPMQTIITDVVLRANGKDSAWFEFTGLLFSCGFDVHHGGISKGESGWLTFSGYGGHSWRVKTKSEIQQ